MNVYIVTYPVPNNIKTLVDIRAFDYLIAVDRAVTFVDEQKLKIDLAVGDFDSIDNLSLLSELNIKRLDKEKDETDTHVAIKIAKSLKPKQIYLLGGLGGQRFEHSYVHLLLLRKYKSLIIINNESTIRLFKKGRHIIDFKEYVSIFSVKTAVISLEGFKYPLNNYVLKTDDPIGISNELAANRGIIDIKSGEIMVITSKFDNKKRP